MPGREQVPVYPKMRVYADTSVIGGCEDDEFREPSRRLMERCARGGVTLVFSAVTLQELECAPQAVRDVLRAVGADNLEVIAITGEIRELADRYVESGALNRGMRADAQHIAAATVSGVDVLASWNFRHMVNLSRIRQYGEVNRRMGYPPLGSAARRSLRMKTEAGQKAFDCVKWTRNTRDRISAEIRGMSREELGRWFEDRRPADPFLAELFDGRKAPTGDRASAQASGLACRA